MRQFRDSQLRKTFFLVNVVSHLTTFFLVNVVIHLTTFFLVNVLSHFLRPFVCKISVNGLLTFGSAHSSGVPMAFPQRFVTAVAVFFADVGPVCGGSHVAGDVFYRASNGWYSVVA